MRHDAVSHTDTSWSTQEARLSMCFMANCLWCKAWKGLQAFRERNHFIIITAVKWWCLSRRLTPTNSWQMRKGGGGGIPVWEQEGCFSVKWQTEALSHFSHFLISHHTCEFCPVLVFSLPGQSASRLPLKTRLGKLFQGPVYSASQPSARFNEQLQGLACIRVHSRACLWMQMHPDSCIQQCNIYIFTHLTNC